MENIAYRLRNRIKRERASLTIEVADRKVILENVPAKLLRYSADSASCSYRKYDGVTPFHLHFGFSNDNKYSAVKVRKTAAQKIKRFERWLGKNFLYTYDDKIKHCYDSTFKREGVIDFGNGVEGSITVQGYEKPDGCKLVKHTEKSDYSYFTAECMDD